MAINPETLFTGQIKASSADYPYGEARNDVTAGDRKGTPWLAPLVNDIFGFQQELLTEAGVSPTGNPEKVAASQYADSLRRIGAYKWNTATLYQAGAIAIGSDFQLYQSQTSQSGNDPVPDSGTNWKLHLLDRARQFTTLTAAKADANLKAGQTVVYAERTAGNGGGATADIIAGTGTANGIDIIAHDSLSLSIVVRLGGVIDAAQLGLAGSGDEFSILDRAMTLGSGRTVTVRTSCSISDELVFVAGNSAFVVEPGVSITQTTADKSVIKGTSLDNVSVFAQGATLKGEGTWSAGWTGNAGHNDRVVLLQGCTNSTVYHGKYINGGNAGIALIGGVSNALIMPTIEGTHNHSTALPAGANFQNGLYLKHDPTYGAVKNLRVVVPDISGTAQGILVEGYSGFAPGEDLNNQVVAPVIHGIPGQHGVYCQAGSVNFDSVNIDDCNLDGVKIQDNGTVEVCDIRVTGIASNCGSHALELQAEVAGGKVDGVIADMISRNCQRGFGANATILNSNIRVVAKNSTQYGAIVQGDGIEELDLDLVSDGAGRHGLYVTAPNSAGLRIKARTKKSGTSAANTYDGIHIENAGDIELQDPNSDDADGNHRYAFYAIAGNVKVRGSGTFKDGTTHDVRADVDILEWPSEVNLSTGTTVSRMQDLKRFSKSSHTIKATAQSTSATNVSVWQTEIPDESAWAVEAEVVAKLADSSEREFWKRAVLCYRDGGGNVTIEGQSDILNTASAGSTAALTWEASGTTIRLRANSGAAATYDWQARVTYTEVS